MFQWKNTKRLNMLNELIFFSFCGFVNDQLYFGGSNRKCLIVLTSSTLIVLRRRARSVLLFPSYGHFLCCCVYLLEQATHFYGQQSLFGDELPMITVQWGGVEVSLNLFSLLTCPSWRMRATGAAFDLLFILSTETMWKEGDCVLSH